MGNDGFIIREASGGGAAMRRDLESLYLQWIEDYYRDVYRWCLRYAGNEHDAADLTQETFTSAFRHMHNFRGESSPRTWLLTIATRAYLRFARKAGRSKRPPRNIKDDWDEIAHMTTGETTEERAVQSLEGEEVWGWVLDLPDRERIAITLFYGEDLPYQEIATVMDVSLQQVRNFLHRGRERLKQQHVRGMGDEDRLHR
ncbi:RNA polymerase sigma factor [Alicyclobacillus mengziensis]|uniref:RNA polymerase sigma factor n=1 Tax=Alicyclobacillus mengziensis TaxID=2931921 RepID=A0A9X7Z615_9BACL|nr:RNA polymerase sigma factor [Alicyclobacillus mengziensis]QSO45841.1 RNA polymerase sigma factor [Alicyclobacillus mengziensis]